MHFGNLPILTIVVVVLIIFLLGFFIFAWHRKSRYEVQRSLEELQGYVNELEERFSLIRPHILEYFNSIHADGDDSLEVLNLIMSSLQAKVKDAGELLGKGDKESIREAAQILSSDLDFTAGNALGIVPKDEEMWIIPPVKWEPVIEQLFQGIGQKVAEASITVSSYRKPLRKRRGTIATLIEAGVKGLAEQKSRISASFKSPFQQPGKK